MQRSPSPCFLLVAALLGCAGGDMSPPAVQVDEVAYSSQQLERVTLDMRERLAELTAFGLAVSRGELGPLGEPFIHRERESILLHKLAGETALRESGMDEAALEATYYADPAEELVVRHFVVLSERWRSDEERAEARRKAIAGLARVEAGEDFAAVAAEVSEEPGAQERGGLLEPGRAGSWVPEFWEAASALRPGGVSPVIETTYGFHVLKLEERRPVPFAEARDDFVLRYTADPSIAARAEKWAEEEAASISVDSAAIAAWRSGEASDRRPLARWPEGAYTGEDLAEYVLTLERDERARLTAAPAGAYVGVVSAAARGALLAERARELGLALTPEEESTAARRWRLRAEAWATALGFEHGQERTATRRAALESLTSTKQNVHLARAEIETLGPQLHALYAISVRGPGEPAESASLSPERQ